LPEVFRKHVKDEIADYISGSEKDESGIAKDPR